MVDVTVLPWNVSEGGVVMITVSCVNYDYCGEVAWGIVMTGWVSLLPDISMIQRPIFPYPLYFVRKVHPCALGKRPIAEAADE